MQVCTGVLTLIRQQLRWIELQGADCDHADRWQMLRPLTSAKTPSADSEVGSAPARTSADASAGASSSAATLSVCDRRALLQGLPLLPLGAGLALSRAVHGCLSWAGCLAAKCGQVQGGSVGDRSSWAPAMLEPQRVRLVSALRSRRRTAGRCRLFFGTAMRQQRGTSSCVQQLQMEAVPYALCTACPIVSESSCCWWSANEPCRHCQPCSVACMK